MRFTNMRPTSFGERSCTLLYSIINKSSRYCIFLVCSGQSKGNEKVAKLCISSHLFFSTSPFSAEKQRLSFLPSRIDFPFRCGAIPQSSQIWQDRSHRRFLRTQDCNPGGLWMSNATLLLCYFAFLMSCCATVEELRKQVPGAVLYQRWRRVLRYSDHSAKCQSTAQRNLLVLNLCSCVSAFVRLLLSSSSSSSSSFIYRTH